MKRFEEISFLICKEHGQKIEFMDLRPINLQQRTFCKNCKNPESDYLVDINLLPKYAEEFHLQAKQFKSNQEKEITSILNICNEIMSIFNLHTQNIGNLSLALKNLNTPDIEFYNQYNSNFSSLSSLEEYLGLLAHQQKQTRQKSYDDLKRAIEQEFLHFKTDFDQKNEDLMMSTKKLNELCGRVHQQVSAFNDVLKINQILCPHHRGKFVEYLDMNEKSLIRLLCHDCNLANKKIKKLEERFRKHVVYYNQLRTEAEEDAKRIYQLIAKSKEVIRSILGYMAEELQNEQIQIDNVLKELKTELNQESYLFDINNYKQLQNFAESHYQMFYQERLQRGNISYQKYFHQQLKNFNKNLSFINEKANNFFPQQIRFLEFHFQILQNQMKNASIIDIEVLSKAQIEFEDNLIGVLYYEAYGKFACSTSKEMILFDWEGDVKNIGQVFQTQKTETIQMICFQQNFKWFATVQNQCQLAFWGLQDSSEAISYQLESSFKLNSIESLKINQKDNSCFSFHKDKFTIWKKLNYWQRIKSVKIQDFFTAQFNCYFSTLALSQSDQSQYLSFYQIEGFNVQEPAFLLIPECKKKGKLTDIYFVGEKQDNELFLVIYEDLIFLLRFQGPVLQMIPVEPLYIIFSKFLFNESQKLLALFDQDSDIITLFSLSEGKHQKMVQIKQLKSKNQIINLWFSISGEELLIFTKHQEQKTYKLNIISTEKKNLDGST